MTLHPEFVWEPEILSAGTCGATDGEQSPRCTNQAGYLVRFDQRPDWGFPLCAACLALNRQRFRDSIIEIAQV